MAGGHSMRGLAFHDVTIKESIHSTSHSSAACTAVNALHDLSCICYVCIGGSAARAAAGDADVKIIAPQKS